MTTSIKYFDLNDPYAVYLRKRYFNDKFNKVNIKIIKDFGIKDGSYIDGFYNAVAFCFLNSKNSHLFEPALDNTFILCGHNYLLNKDHKTSVEKLDAYKEIEYGTNKFTLKSTIQVTPDHLKIFEELSKYWYNLPIDLTPADTSNTHLNQLLSIFTYFGYFYLPIRYLCCTFNAMNKSLNDCYNKDGCGDKINTIATSTYNMGNNRIIDIHEYDFNDLSTYFKNPEIIKNNPDIRTYNTEYQNPNPPVKSSEETYLDTILSNFRNSVAGCCVKTGANHDILCFLPLKYGMSVKLIPYFHYTKKYDLLCTCIHICVSMLKNLITFDKANVNVGYNREEIYLSHYFLYLIKPIIDEIDIISVNFTSVLHIFDHIKGMPDFNPYYTNQSNIDNFLKVFTLLTDITLNPINDYNTFLFTFWYVMITMRKKTGNAKIIINKYLKYEVELFPDILDRMHITTTPKIDISKFNIYAHLNLLTYDELIKWNEEVGSTDNTEDNPTSYDEEIGPPSYKEASIEDPSDDGFYQSEFDDIYNHSKLTFINEMLNDNEQTEDYSNLIRYLRINQYITLEEYGFLVNNIKTDKIKYISIVGDIMKKLPSN